MPDQSLPPVPPPAPPPMAPYVDETPSSAPAPALTEGSSPLDRIKLKLSSFGGLTPKLRIYLPRFLVILVVLVVLIILVPYGLKILKNQRAVPTPAPSVVPSPTPEIFNPSPYAQDEKVLAIEVKIEEIEKELKIINFREDTLKIPSLDWDIKF